MKNTIYNVNSDNSCTMNISTKSMKDRTDKTKDSLSIANLQLGEANYPLSIIHCQLSILTALLIVFCLLFGGRAFAETLTVYEDGASTNYYVPMFVFYFDDFSRAQTVFPAEDLAEMAGGTITSITFYTTNSNIPYTAVSSADIYLTEVGSTSISAYVDKSSAQTVCSGYFNFVSDGNGGGMVTITLSTPYIYQGGNLLFGCDNTEDIGYKQIIFKGKTASGASISGYNSSSTGTISVNSRNFLPKTTFTYTPGAAPSCPILTIANATQWNAFAQCVADGNNYSGQTVTLTNDISVTTMVGNSSHPFSGTFEGNGKTITVNISSSDQGAAPFRYISGATIQNLKVEGTVTSTAHHASGLVGFCTDGSTNTIRNCLVSTNVTNNNNYDGDNGNNYIGGIIGHNLSSTTSIIGCVYNGTLTSQGFKGGMVGFGNYNSNVTITDSYFAGAYSANGYSNPNFSPISCHGAGRNFIFTFSNFYYNTDAGTFTAPSYEGTENATYNGAGRAMHAYSVIGITPVTVAMNGTPTRTYNVSGIDVYATGIVFDNTIYAASGASLSLNLDGSDRGYLSDHGTLTGSANPYTLAMDAYNTKIAINCLVTSFPWEEDFEGFSASSSGVKLEDPCWVNEHIEGTGTYFFEVYSGTNGTNSTKQVRLRDMYSGTKTKLMLPPMDFGGVAYQFSLDVFRNATGTNYGEGVRVYASTDGNIEGATELAFISRSYQTSDGNLIPAESASGWYRYELILPHTGTCYIILRGESQYGSSTYMDNFRVELAPTCPKPTGLSVNPDGLSAILNWSGSSDSFDVACSTSSSADPSSNIVETGIQENTYTKNNLTIDNDYYFWVRANCGGEGYSTWTGPVSVHIGYCKPNPTSVDGKGITTLTFGSGDYTVNNSNSNGLPASSPYYADYTSMVGGYEQGETATVTITYSTGNYTVYSYGTIIWVDWNKNYTFEDSEIVYTGTSAQGSNGTPQVLTATFSIPANQAGGDYCMRIAGADSYFDSYIGGSASANHDPCFTSTYAVCHDYTLRVISSTPTITATANPAAGGTVTFMAGPASGATVNTHLPLDSYYDYGLSEQIYTPAEIGGGTINSIAFYSERGSTNTGGIAFTRTIDIYMAHTNKSAFDNTNDWISVSSGDKVFSGAVTFNFEEWTIITFSTPFVYNGTSNLVLVVDDNTGDDTPPGNYLTCRAFTPDGGGNCSLFVRGGTNYDPTNPTNRADELQTVKNQILINPGNGSSTRTFPQGASCTLVATANANYNFDNWTEGSTELSTNEVYTVSNITADHTIVGNFSLPTFTLTTSVNPSGGGTITCSPSSANGVYTYGTVVTLTANAATGYTFQNWTVDGVTVSGSPTSVTMTADHNVVANFTINTYTVTYNANGGSGTMSSNSYNYNSSVTVMANGFTAPSCKQFSGWKDGNETPYVVGSTFNMPASNVTLYAQWEDIPRTLSISGAPGSGVVCTSSETTLTATTDALSPTYTWSAPSGAGLTYSSREATVKPTAVGTYTIVCSVAHSCGTLTESVTLEARQGATIGDFPASPVSACGSYDITPSISNTNCSEVSWYWGSEIPTSGDPTQRQITETGDYTFTVTKSTLKQYDMITQNGVAAIVVVVPTMTNDGKAVPIGTGGIGANATAGNVADGALTNLQEAIKVNGGETYSGNREGFVIPAGAAGGVCQSTASVEVEINTPAVGTVTASAAPATICNGSSSELTASATGNSGTMSYAWSNGESGATVSVSPTVNTTYTVTATATVGGCIATTTKQVTVAVNSPAVGTVTASADPATICNGSSSELTAGATGNSGTMSYAWSNGESGATVSVSPTVNTTYTVTATATVGG
ncbi:MAG: hypothetical protein IKK36_10075, partial [Bacteroidales bacterium]|nr:hypothetical protein [Bacteroidales bacterium]